MQMYSFLMENKKMDGISILFVFEAMLVKSNKISLHCKCVMKKQQLLSEER